MTVFTHYDTVSKGQVSWKNIKVNQRRDRMTGMEILSPYAIAGIKGVDVNLDVMETSRLYIGLPTFA